ncbi:MAG: glutamate racemase [Bacteroidales bacterium]|nr:glutamate racemase [Bacteroidales bacterium]
MMSGAAIGVLDSGIGGLSVHAHIKALLPKERLIYVADTAYCPYGTKPVEIIRERSLLLTRFLLEQGCKLVVVACNTATAAAIHTLRSLFPQELIVGMEPAVKPAILHTKSGVVGVLATRGTFRGPLYNTTLAAFAGPVRVLEAHAEGWVEAVERGEFDTPATEEKVREVIDPMLTAGADHLVLGCTHYPFLVPVIRKIAGPGVTIVDPAPAVARRVRFLLSEKGRLAEKQSPPGEDLYYTSCLDTSMLPKAVPYTAKGGTINWRPYTFENTE